ncbi:hypothetical protein OUZ56_017495 [Daphnia magna]|uniref:Uncharacterized protein n=1 Tax=Daphnia magna TaxID=35525 RepID=A0ABR0ASX1_9CRUS|nr:hypothetical protein OUZ56_017495 [Daphnia magna]
MKLNLTMIRTSQCRGLASFIMKFALQMLGNKVDQPNGGANGRDATKRAWSALTKSRLQSSLQRARE